MDRQTGRKESGGEEGKQAGFKMSMLTGCGGTCLKFKHWGA